MKITPNENIFLLILVANMLLTISLINVYDADGFEVVQIDVEPLDVYFGKTFLVHNKGSDSNPF